MLHKLSLVHQHHNTIFYPQSLADFKDNEIDVISKVAANKRLGMSTPDAVAAVESYAMLSPDQKATLNRKTKEIATENTTRLGDQVSDHAGYDIPWWPVDPDTPPFMDSEYTAMVKRHLPDVGFDMKVAQNLAFADVTKRWQLTDINGDHEIMKFAPQGKTELVRKSIAKQYKGVMPELEQLTDGRAMSKNIRISSDQLTAIQVSRGIKPTYQAFVVLDKDTGEIFKLPRFSWDSEQSKKDEKARLTEEGKVARAKRNKKQAAVKENKSTVSKGRIAGMKL